ncbi:type II secretion system protein GspL [Acinetobacter puyangensis]|uniref:Type II secretion system protein L n=1 Tax=Acinetobacter puyangensis TaxID=1096779 RepID=A0A240E5X9_9GAMM|nr:type II secretion system protein GspL [Acinetobacter puyangensis]SNX44164.1 general secretion pathway protein L [Acinetobacter puyangensis]
MLYLAMPEGQGQWLWQLDDGAWQVADSIDQLIQTVQILYKGIDCVVFFPSQSAQFFTQALPRAQYKQLGQQGVAYLIEEYTIDPIDHLAIFHDFHDDQVNFMAMSQMTRETYQKSLALLPWHVLALLPDFLLVPVPDKDNCNIAQIFDRKLVRWSLYRGWSFDDVTLLAQLPVTVNIANLYQLDDGLTASVKAIIGDDVDYRVLALDKINISRFKQHPFNALLKTKRKQNSGANYWKACAAILCLAVIAQVTYDTLQWWKYQSIANQTAQLAIDQYKQWFPNESRINEQNLNSNFKSKLSSNAAADRQVLQLISRVGPILQQANIAAEQVTYQDNVLNLSLIARNSDVLTRLTEQFKQQGFAVELGAIRNQGSNVIGLVKVQ